MKKDELLRLLEKYYNSGTTIDEEAILREYFRENIVGEELAPESQIFKYYSEQSVIRTPGPEFEERTLSALDYRIRKDSFLKRRKLLYSLTGVAAGLLLIAGSYFFFTNKTAPADTFSDPEIAYAAAMEILYDVSLRLNQGTRAFEPISKMNDITVKSMKSVAKPAALIEENLITLDQLGRTLRMMAEE